MHPDVCTGAHISDVSGGAHSIHLRCFWRCSHIAHILDVSGGAHTVLTSQMFLEVLTSQVYQGLTLVTKIGTVFLLFRMDMAALRRNAFLCVVV
jgi:hypothetical protein